LLDARKVQQILENEYFNSYRETFKVIEYKGFSLDQLDELAGDLACHVGSHHASKVHFIRFHPSYKVDVYEFIVEEKRDTGTVIFGLVALTKNRNTVEAVACVYELDFTLGHDIITETTTSRSLFFSESKIHTRTQQRSLPNITREAMENFCLIKAHGELKKKIMC